MALEPYWWRPIEVDGPLLPVALLLCADPPPLPPLLGTGTLLWL
jgi:hypothetical protein